MSVAGSISNALLRFGRPMILRRTTLAAGSQLIPLDVTVYGTTKNYAADELIGGIIQGDTEVTFGNAEIEAAQWPGPPRTGDKVFPEEKQRSVISVESKYLGTDVLVHVCQVRG